MVMLNSTLSREEKRRLAILMKQDHARAALEAKGHQAGEWIVGPRGLTVQCRKCKEFFKFPFFQKEEVEASCKS